MTASGVVLGVAVFIALRTANQSVIFAFSETVNHIAGRTQLEVTAGDSGFSEDVLDKIQGASCVRVAVPVIEAVVDTQGLRQGSLLVLGVDMTGDRSLRDYDLNDDTGGGVADPLVFLAQPDSLILSKELAAKSGVAVGSRLSLGTTEGVKAFVVRGLMRSSGLASAFGGNVAVMDIYAAQKMFGRGRTFDRVDLAVKPNVSLDTCERELSSLLGPAFRIQPPASRGRQFETMLTGYTTMIGVSSAFALFVGMFMIYNSFSIAVTQRRTEIGILRALGATAGQIQRLFLAESAILGLLGSILGVAFGLLVARLAVSLISSLVTDIYGVAQQPSALIATSTVVFALGLGIATSLIAAVIPARNAALIDPVHAMKKGMAQMLSPSEHRVRLAAALTLGLLSVICVWRGTSQSLFFVGYGFFVAAAVIASPLVALGIARLVRHAITRLGWVEGTLAIDSLVSAPRRTTASVLALMLSLALVTAFDGASRSSYRSVTRWVNTTLNPDLFVMPSQKFETQTARFPAAMSREIAGVPGIERVQGVRNSRILFRETPITVVALDIASIAQTARPESIAGDTEDMYRRASAGEGIIVSDNLAQLQHLAAGQVLEIPAPYGVIRLPIVGTVLDYSDQQGAIILDRRLYDEHWHDDSVNIFRIYLDHGASPMKVKEQILDLYAGRRQVFVLTNGDLKTYILGLAGRWFSLTTVQIAVAVLVAILGIVNTLTVSIIDRRRELGVLRAIGALPGEIRRTIWYEAIGIGALGLALGCALGAINLYYVLQIVQHNVTGTQLRYEFPIGTTLSLVPIIISASFIAALWPAESAVRDPLIEALEYE
jgi:putative ABC transport system permease protein